MAAFWPIGTAQIIRIVFYPIRKKSRFWLFCMWSVKEMYHALLPKTDYWALISNNGGNEWRQKNNRFITLFCTFLYHPCMTTTSKCLIASSMEDVNKRQQISFSLSKLECGPQEINCREIHYICHFQQIGINATKIEKNGNSF